MKKRKSNLLYYLSFMVAVFALGSMIMAIGRYVSMMPAEDYEDREVMEFVAAEWYTKTENVHRQGGAPAHTRYNYYVMRCLVVFLFSAVYLAGFIVFIIKRRIGE